MLGLKSRGGVYRKIRSGELPTVTGPDGSQCLEREGLEDRWRQITREQRNSPKPLRPASERVPRPAAQSRPADGEVPDYTTSRARAEHEKANLLELDRRTKEGELVYRADFVTAQNAVAAQIMNRAEALPRQIKQAIPHLLVEEVEKIERLIKEMMEGVANWSYDELGDGE